ncbi:HBL/NHE enterotoxin family protein, partial [Bacillus thuringiensis]|uniref:HBL/NHE enterotoxin family protein n=1 Tax=Bacillus thuringiensis TaxID=1428 RepID=UPI0011A70C26
LNFNQAILHFRNDFPPYPHQLLQFLNQKNKLQLPNPLNLLPPKPKTYQHQTQKQLHPLQKFTTHLPQHPTNFQTHSHTILIYFKTPNTPIQPLLHE